ncbi:MAG: deoxyribodipyrimidine photo-lyase [Sulfolobales archaeon]|nr:deoxyribodipyrimidine photo-lyase [Sulfolobales archaeon]
MGCLAIYWFKRDLRSRDNRALIRAHQLADRVAPLFIIDPELLSSLSIGKDDPRLGFVLSAARSLAKELPLHVLYERTEEAFERALSGRKVDYVVTAKPLTWSGRERVERVRRVVERHGAKLVEVEDETLADLKSFGNHQTFTSFYGEWRKKVDGAVSGTPRLRTAELDLPRAEEGLRALEFTGPMVWSAEACRERLESYDFGKYAETRNFPGVDSSLLSPCIRLGILSVREVYEKALPRSEAFVRQLAWREFYYWVAYRFPETRQLELRRERRKIKWENDPELMRAFEEGRTGYPIVDAGIRELKRRKWVHNRVRLILGSFLTKDLLVDWRWGEELFRKHLVDYDEMVNLGNWQWVASVGIDPVPLRIFNPVEQAKKYDPECAYIKRWLPELSSYPCYQLQDPLRFRIKGYVEPIVDHYERAKKAKEAFRA